MKFACVVVPAAAPRNFQETFVTKAWGCTSCFAMGYGNFRSIVADPVGGGCVKWRIIARLFSFGSARPHAPVHVGSLLDRSSAKIIDIYAKVTLRCPFFGYCSQFLFCFLRPSWSVQRAPQQTNETSATR